MTSLLAKLAPEPEPPQPTETIIREATQADMPLIMEWRKRQEREFTGHVDLPMNMVWLVGERNGVPCAAAGGAFSTAQDHAKTAIVTDFYDNGSLSGKRALMDLVEDACEAKAAGVKLWFIVPLDRMRLVEALERRGLHRVGIQME